jgi:hypothetical protein
VVLFHSLELSKEVMTVGFYGSVFFRSWLVVAQNVEGPRGKTPKVSMILSAATAEDACDMMRNYLTAEGFQFGPIAAFFG